MKRLGRHTSKNDALRVEMLVHLHPPRAPRLLPLVIEVFRRGERVREGIQGLVHRDVVRHGVVAEVVGSDAHALSRSDPLGTKSERGGEETEDSSGG